MATKKLAAATLVRRMDQWHHELYGKSLLDGDSDTTLGTFIKDVREAEFNSAVRQIPGQTKIEADEDGTVAIRDDAPDAEGEE